MMGVQERHLSEMAVVCRERRESERKQSLRFFSLFIYFLAMVSGKPFFLPSSVSFQMFFL